MVVTTAALPDMGVEEEPINYRTAGRKASGNLAREKKVTPTSEGDIPSSTVPSIPSKLETVLYKGERENKAFGSRALRFDALRDESAAGPGSYSVGTTIGKIPTGWGKRGTGGFASISKRFNAVCGYPVPGPGSYAVVQVGTSASASSSGPNAAFVAPKYGGVLKDNQVQPSMYDVSGNLSRKPVAASGSSAFADKSERAFGKASAEGGPPPGTYNVEGSLAARPGSGRMPTRNFMAPAATRKVNVAPNILGPEVPSDLSHADRKGEYVKEAKKLAEKIQPEPASYTLPSTLNTGQKQWNPNTKTVIVERSEMSSKKFEVVKSSRMKAKAREPGPGSYDPKLDIVRPEVARNISALRATGPQREPLKAKTAPGPAYYKTEAARHSKDRKSFHLNLKSSWVS